MQCNMLQFLFVLFKAQSNRNLFIYDTLIANAQLSRMTSKQSQIGLGRPIFYKVHLTCYACVSRRFVFVCFFG